MLRRLLLSVIITFNLIKSADIQKQIEAVAENFRYGYSIYQKKIDQHTRNKNVDQRVHYAKRMAVKMERPDEVYYMLKGYKKAQTADDKTQMKKLQESLLQLGYNLSAGKYDNPPVYD